MYDHVQDQSRQNLPKFRIPQIHHSGFKVSNILMIEGSKRLMRVQVSVQLGIL